MTQVLLLTTGGTIASTRDGSGISRPGNGIGVDVDSDVRTVSLMTKDSASLDFADMDAIVAEIVGTPADACAGFVVVHGTDTMEETALLVDLFHDDPRPVVFTGAQRTRDHSDPDGPSNVADAVAAARDPRNTGVHVCFGGRLIPARGLTKLHTTNLDAFDAPSTDRPSPLPRLSPLPPVPISRVRVDTVALYPGVDATAIDAYVAAGADGLVLDALGSGNTNPVVVQAVRACTDAGIPVVVTTRVARGEIAPTYGGGGGGADLVAAGAVFSTHLRAGQARVQLAALIASGWTDLAGRFGC